ncbi:MAG: biotin--[acetyl-CoA-carboxylase] ligase [Candidatus Gastranaerophilales bacterium]|nr:biotin--[acetyl-CoA-carboxylase] ligase [Candidatus Gastranaerophilales bacterium]
MNIIKFKKLNSTNKYAKENLEKLADRTIISAEIQTNGYGRFERPWIDLGGENIYMTFVLKPSKKFSQEHICLTILLADCLCEKLEEMGLKPEIKPPNDVLINGKKISGILAESITKGEKLKGIVLGIGINLNASPDNFDKIDKPVTSLNIELGKKINKEKFMQELIEIFFDDYNFWLNGC